METNSRNKAEKFWDRAAGSYDREEKRDGKIHLAVTHLAKNYLKSTDTVLDFGCGTGLYSRELSGTVKTIHAIDLSSKMIALARTKTQEPNIAYSQATIFDEHLKPGSYDVILNFYILHLLDDPEAAVIRMHHLLKSGGLLISATPSMGEKPFLAGLFSIFSKVALVPQIKPFKLNDLEKLLTMESFKISESKLLPGTSNQYFTVSKKTGHGLS